MIDTKNSVRLLYLAPYYSEALGSSRRNRTYRSPAGLNKMRGIVAALDSAGCSVTVVSPVLFGQMTGSWFPRHEEPLGKGRVIYPATWDVPVLGIMVTIITSFLAVLKLKRQGVAQRIVFYNFLLATAVPAFLAKAFLGIPLVVEYEDGLFADPDIPRTKRLISLLLERLGRGIVTGGILVSGTLARRLLTTNTCICRGFCNLPPEGACRGDGRTIFYAGRFDSARGIDIFLDAVAKLTQEARVVITGYGPLEEQVRKRVSEIANVPVTLHGFLSPGEFQKVRGGADILVNPQRSAAAFGRSSFPSKVYEYMSTGKVVVSSRVADIEAIADGKVVLYDGDSPVLLANTLDEILSDFEAYRPYGERALRWISVHCTPGAAGKEILQVVERA